MIIDLTEEELAALRESIRGSWSEGLCACDDKLLLKLGFDKEKFDYMYDDCTRKEGM